jgi:hypothetical protein
MDGLVHDSELPPITTAEVSQGSESAKKDSLGYLVADATDDETLRPSYQLGPVRGGSVRSMMKALRKHKYEGVFSLFKGRDMF